MAFIDLVDQPASYNAKKSRVYTDAEKIAYFKKKARTQKGKKRTYRKQSRRGGGGGRGGHSVIYPNIVSGYGAYQMDPNDSYGKQWGGKAGSYLGELLGGTAQNLLGGLISGLGDYDVKHNVLLAPEPPTIINDSVKGGITFRHREYLRDIITSGTAGAFNIDSYLINPGNEKTFPWLSQVATNFEQYSLEGVIFEFRSMSADALNSTNTALGTVIMATNYDSVDALFKTKGEMENYEWGMSTKPSCNMLHPIECAPRQTSITELYILNGPVPAGTDPRLYHWGNMQIATNGFQGTSVNIGELWITYQVRLLKPKLFVALGNEIGAYSSRNSTFTNALPIGNGTLTTFTDTIGIVLDPPNRNIGFPIQPVRKHYAVELHWQGNLTAVTYPILTFTESAQTAFISSVGLIGPGGGETCTAMSFLFSVMVNANAFGVVTVGAAGTLPAVGTLMDIRIMEIAPLTF